MQQDPTANFLPPSEEGRAAVGEERAQEPGSLQNDGTFLSVDWDNR